MAYIGRGTDKISNIEKLDTITFDGSSSYTLQKNGVNFSPNSANSLQVSIDGVVQAGNFTVSGSTIDFGVAIPSTSTCDFIFHYGTGLVTTVADGAITTAKLGDASVTSAKLSGVTQGITEVDQWMLTADTGSGVNADVTTNLARASTLLTGVGHFGTGMTESSGVFSFPSTGYWRVDCNAQITVVAGDNAFLGINLSTDGGSTYYIVSQIGVSNRGSSTASDPDSGNVSVILNVTNTSNLKVKFTTNSFSSGTALQGSSSTMETNFIFTKLGV